MSEVMIEVSDLSKRYEDVVAIEKVNLTVNRGEVVGFLGPNGAGKSTTMKILTCFTSADEGSAKVNGCDVLDDSLGVRQAIGYLPETTPLYPDMLVLEYLQFVAQMRGLDSTDAPKRIRTVVEETALGDVFAKEIRTLSKGYRQRVGLAQALIHQPPILILDEPMSGLDPNQAVEIRDLIKDIGRERTVILSTHNLAEVQACCGRVLIIAKGKIVADDTTTALSDRSGKVRYQVTLQTQEGDFAEKARGVLASTAGVDEVRAVSSEDGEHCFEILPEGDDDLRAPLFKAVVDNKMTLLGLNRAGQNLEQIFRDLTTSTDKADPAPVASAEATAGEGADDGEQS